MNNIYRAGTRVRISISGNGGILDGEVVCFVKAGKPLREILWSVAGPEAVDMLSPSIKNISDRFSRHVVKVLVDGEIQYRVPNPGAIYRL